MNVDEVLAKMDALDASEEEIQYIIDENLRVISIPLLGVVLGVEGDKDVNSAKFKMVRYYKGIDLSKFDIRINFANANGDLSYYTVKNPTVTDDTLTFEWLVGYLATKYKGTVRFVVRMIITDSSTGEVQQAFDTTVGEARSLEGLLVDTPTDEKVYDLVAQLKADLTDHVNNLIETIPADYSELTKKVEDNTSGISELKEDIDGLKEDQTIETVLPVDAVCVGSYRQGILDSTYKHNIATISYVKPFVVSAKVISADYQLSVVVYKNGVYFKTEGWLSNGTVYTFDHTTYQYKLYIGQVVNGYVYDFEDCRKSIMLTISTANILESYNALETQNDTERRNTKNAVEYMMRRKYDISYANAPAPLGLITYVGNNQVVHPKVLYFPNKFGNRKYWMAYTPYPFANDRYENPCVAYSSDGYNWTNIDGNPLDDPAGDGYNSDTHLVYVESTGTLEIWYRYVSNYKNPPVSEIIYRQTTKNGINWTEKEVVAENSSGNYVQYLSPAVIHDGKKYKVWVVNDTSKTINYYESKASADEETIKLDGSMNVGKVDQIGRVDTSATDYMYTAKIKLNAAKSFQLTGINTKGIVIHPALRYVTAYDANGDVLNEYCLQSIAEASTAVGRTITMNAAVDSVIVTIYKASNYTNKTVTLPAVGSNNGLTKVRDITLTYQAAGKTYNPWHLDVIEDNGKTVLLIMCKSGTTWSLFLSTSVDNIAFTTPELVVAGNPYGWDTRLYRSSIVNVDGEYRIYYSAQNEIQKYGLGVCTSDKLSGFVGKW